MATSRPHKKTRPSRATTPQPEPSWPLALLLRLFPFIFATIFVVILTGMPISTLTNPDFQVGVGVLKLPSFAIVGFTPRIFRGHRPWRQTVQAAYLFAVFACSVYAVIQARPLDDPRYLSRRQVMTLFIVTDYGAWIAPVAYMSREGYTRIFGEKPPPRVAPPVPSHMLAALQKTITVGPAIILVIGTRYSWVQAIGRWCLVQLPSGLRRFVVLWFTVPFLIRTFVKIGSFHRITLFEDGTFPTTDEQQLFTWKDATLREILTTLRNTAPHVAEYRHPLARFSFRTVYVEQGSGGRFVSKDIGEVYSRDILGEPGTIESTAPRLLEDSWLPAPPPTDSQRQERTLDDLRFVPGDFLLVAVLLPKSVTLPSQLSIKGAAPTSGEQWMAAWWCGWILSCAWWSRERRRSLERRIECGTRGSDGTTVSSS
ncbi:hypothetical protein HMN09_00596500 [Mycena chlorophos]|uniref:Uncharacterized protein n=1 Tax=Mycena chlorophos TaxID=658473 RepID=A0A8H6T3W2_MYCCL|nr:hypothetical protein HMN09_00596500 [Mycena chlorophos]